VQKVDISLDPKKVFFGMVEGKLLGHSVSFHGSKNNLARVEAINTIPLPRHKKTI
jgi:hypothetical protein